MNRKIETAVLKESPAWKSLGLKMPQNTSNPMKHTQKAQNAQTFIKSSNLQQTCEWIILSVPLLKHPSPTHFLNHHLHHSHQIQRLAASHPVN